MTKHLAFLATCDLVGHVRGRALDAKDIVKDKRSTGWVPADLSLTSFGFIAHPEPFGSFGDIRLDPILDTKVTFKSWSADGRDVDFYLTHLLNPDGSTWRCDPRSALQSALMELENQHDVEVRASFEHEFLLSGPGLEGGKPFGFDSFRAVKDFGDELFFSAQEMGLEPENWLPEYAACQFELTLKPAPALVAADRAIILRELLKDLASKRQIVASFAPLSRPDSVGNGVHIHFSLWKGDKPLSFDPDSEGKLSQRMALAAAGILQHLGAVLTWSAPSQISFLRLKPHKWSAGIREIAVQNREAVLRICPVNQLHGGDPRKSFNLEFRGADATANPWLALAALVRAMTAGMSAGNLPARILDGPLEGRSDLVEMPESLNEAIIEYKASEVASSWFDEVLVAAHLAIRDAEEKYLADLTIEERCRRYLDVY